MFCKFLKGEKMLTFLLFMLNFSYSQSIDNCIEEKYKYKYYYNGENQMDYCDLKFFIYSKENTDIIIKFTLLNTYKSFNLPADSIHEEVFLDLGVISSNNYNNSFFESFSIADTSIVPMSGLIIYSTKKIYVNSIVQSTWGNCSIFGATNLLSNIQSGKEYRLNFPPESMDYSSILNISSFYDNNEIYYKLYGTNVSIKKKIILNKGQNINFRILNESYFNFTRDISNIKLEAKYPIAIYDINSNWLTIRSNKQYAYYPNNLLGMSIYYYHSNIMILQCLHRVIFLQ